ncbi:chitinase 11-like protein [Carex littledalei]|uniref:chitinase n=1 Tax=Carex littledalei TaxID=544730 RepID=A0A833VDW0_9POAL|nr:chitinase 11-like protein [Carex littledalei]
MGYHRSISFTTSSSSSSSLAIVGSKFKSRSTSLPCRSDPLISRLEQHSLSIRSWARSTQSDEATWISDGLSLLSHLLASLLDLFSHPQAAEPLRLYCSEKLLEDLLRLADAHSCFRDSLISLNQALTETQTAVRRRDATRLAAAVRAQRRAEKELSRFATSAREVSRFGRISTSNSEAVFTISIRDSVAVAALASANIFSFVAGMSGESVFYTDGIAIYEGNANEEGLVDSGFAEVAMEKQEEVRGGRGATEGGRVGRGGQGRGNGEKTGPAEVARTGEFMNYYLPTKPQPKKVKAVHFVKIRSIYNFYEIVNKIKLPQEILVCFIIGVALLPITFCWHLKKINLISLSTHGHISDIKLIRTDTTLDLSQKADKGYLYIEEIKKTDPPYYGRGPIQLTHKYNYEQAGKAINEDLVTNPDLVSSDPVISFKTAIWYWMTAQAAKPSCHSVMTGQWSPSDADKAAGRVPGYGLTTNIINGGKECHGVAPNLVADRTNLYKGYCDMLGVGYGDNLDCNTQMPYPSN